MVEIKSASLFYGIGGFDLASDWIGWENIFHCECSSKNRDFKFSL